jgi:SAM-dependent methyltransferase
MMVKSIVELKRTQAEHHDQHFGGLAATRFESNLHHDHFRAMPFLRVQELLQAQGIDLNDQRVLVASCGSGIDVHYLKKLYPRANFFVSDLSGAAVERAVRAFPGVQGQVEDGEAMSFADDHFDYAFIAGSLHHLPRPMLGLYELLRVARHAAIVIEPNDCGVIRLATRLGLATEVEAVGNYVYRFSVHDVKRVARSLFTTCVCAPLFAIHRVARSRAEFLLLRLLNALANQLIPSQGNTLVFVIFKAGAKLPN